MRLVVSPQGGAAGAEGTFTASSGPAPGRARDVCLSWTEREPRRGVCCLAGSPACPRMTNVVSAKMNQTSCQVLGRGRGFGTKKAASTG